MCHGRLGQQALSAKIRNPNRVSAEKCARKSSKNELQIEMINAD